MITAMLFTVVFGVAADTDMVVSDEDFLKACHEGFKVSFPKAEKAVELGWGTAEIKTKADPQTWEKVTWYSWTNDQGIIRVIFNGLIDEGTLGKVWAHGNATPMSAYKDTDWSAWRNSGITENRHQWVVKQSQIRFTWLSLGQVGEKPKQNLQERLDELKELGIINNAAMSK